MAPTQPSNPQPQPPFMLIHDRGPIFTSRARYRALSMCPTWENTDGTARALLSVNRLIHTEAESHLYRTHTLFFRNSFDPDLIPAFLNTLSPTALASIRSIGFEVFFFVHNDAGVPKRPLRQYEHAREFLATKLPNWKSVLCYLDPRFYYPAAGVGGRELAARGVLDLARRFGDREYGVKLDVSFYPCPLPDGQRAVGVGVGEEAWSGSLGRTGPVLKVKGGVKMGVRGEELSSLSGHGKMRGGDAGNYPIALVG
ncbi:hypothetical protein N7466_000447 [Penicillium verhagenii]|uniref:uncharacterized protein n=1 Tax=Penicillium verhagenii TaxID=1562060 RepID=UPI002545A736|nr:uncharacterized protein N7466_000447 [Penicillium verhagenii]KAJ5947432.1 hypothetical protein N7466_000447 [Penicillium verhagenii]